MKTGRALPLGDQVVALGPLMKVLAANAVKVSAQNYLKTALRALPAPVKQGLRGAVSRGKSIKAKLSRLAAPLVGQYWCPVCERRVMSFDPLQSLFLTEPLRYGYPHTVEESETCNARHYSCPFCEAADRERLYALYLRESLPKITSTKPTIVDFAPARPLSSFILRLTAGLVPGFSYRTADLSMSGVDDLVDITDMPSYADESVDFFICSHVLEHVVDDRKALVELYRILKSGGKGILVVPIVLTIDEIDEDPSVTGEAERWRRFGQGDHVRLYSRGGFVSRIEDAGFVVQQLGRDYFGSDTFRKHGITEQSVLYVVEKK